MLRIYLPSNNSTQLDRWHMLYANQYDNFTCEMCVGSCLPSFQLYDHAIAINYNSAFFCASFNLDLPSSNENLDHKICCLKHALFRGMICNIMLNLCMEVPLDIDLAWRGLIG